MKRLILSIGILALGLVVFSGISYGQSKQDEDSCMIYVSPPTDYSVKIDTPTGGVDFGTIVLDSTYTYTSAISTVTNNGSIVSDWKIMATALDDWSLAETDLDTVDTDSMTICAILSDTTVTTVSNSDFTNSDLLKSSVQNMSAGNYEKDANGENGDEVGEDEQARIWFRIHTPDNTTITTADQGFRITIEAWTNDAF